MTKVMTFWTLFICVVFLVAVVLGVMPTGGRFTSQFGSFVKNVESFQNRFLEPVKDFLFPGQQTDYGEHIKVAMYANNMHHVKNMIGIFSKVTIDSNAYKWVALENMLSTSKGFDGVYKYLLFDVGGNYLQYLYKPNGISVLEDHTNDGVIVSAQWLRGDVLELIYLNQLGEEVHTRLKMEGAVIR